MILNLDFGFNFDSTIVSYLLNGWVRTKSKESRPPLKFKNERGLLSSFFFYLEEQQSYRACFGHTEAVIGCVLVVEAGDKPALPVLGALGQPPVRHQDTGNNHRIELHKMNVIIS